MWLILEDNEPAPVCVQASALIGQADELLRDQCIVVALVARVCVFPSEETEDLVFISREIESQVLHDIRLRNDRIPHGSVGYGSLSIVSFGFDGSEHRPTLVGRLLYSFSGAGVNRFVNYLVGKDVAVFWLSQTLVLLTHSHNGIFCKFSKTSHPAIVFKGSSLAKVDSRFGR